MSGPKEARQALEQRRAEMNPAWASRHTNPGSRGLTIVVIGILLFGVAAFAYVHHLHAAAVANAALSVNQRSEAINGTMPADERRFVGLIAAAAAGYNMDASDADKAAAMHQRALAICAAFPATAVSNWIGTIDTIDSNQMVAAISLYVGSQTGSQTPATPTGPKILLLASAPLLPAAAGMMAGDTVIFSGNLFHDTTGKDCFLENIPSTDSAMQTPSFLMWFSKVTP